MKTKAILSCVILTIVFVAHALAKYGGQAGHVPFLHDHSGHCAGQSGGVCYGYAMGRASGAGSGQYWDCDPATIIPENSCSNFTSWASMQVDGTYFEHFPDPHLNTGGPAIIEFDQNHVAYCPNAINGSPSVTLQHIRSSGEAPNTTDDIMYKQSDNTYKVNINGVNYVAVGYYKLGKFWIIARNQFYSFQSSVTDTGNITLAYWTSKSPNQRELEWNASYTVAVASTTHDYPSGYRQVFTNQWLDINLQPAGTGESITVTPTPAYQRFDAQYYQAAPITFVPESGGAIVVDGSPRQSSYTKYARITNPADNVTAEAVYNVTDRIQYTPSYWTNNLNNDTVRTATISFYPALAKTFTAHFTKKPQSPPNVSAGDTVGGYVHVTWSEHPCGDVNQYQVWRRVKPPGGQLQDPELKATVNRGTTSWIDPTYVVTSGYTDAICNYDVRSYYSPNQTYSDPDWVGVFARYELEKRGAQSEKNPNSGWTVGENPFAVGSYPNPFNPSTTISYQLGKAASVKLEIFDIMGREVRGLVDASKSAGYYTVVWNGRDESGRDVSSGVYLYRFVAAPTDGQKAFMQSGKLMLMR